MHEHRKIRFAIGSFGELCGNATKWTAQVLAFVFQSSANRNANVSFLSSSPFPPNCSDADRDAILCPYDLMGRCEDKQCKYKHIKMWFTVRLGRKILRFLFYHKTKQNKSEQNQSETNPFASHICLSVSVHVCPAFEHIANFSILFLEENYFPFGWISLNETHQILCVHRFTLQELSSDQLDRRQKARGE